MERGDDGGQEQRDDGEESRRTVAYKDLRHDAICLQKKKYFEMALIKTWPAFISLVN